MARPKQEKKQNVFKLLPSDQSWFILDNAMTKSGMYQHIMNTPELMHMIQEKETYLREVKRLDPSTNKDEFMYLSRLPVARKLIAEDNNWMIRVVSDPKRLSSINIVKEEFLKYGPSALPAHYKYARNFGGVFEWHPDANVTIIMMLRGLGKSHNEVVVRSITDFVNDPSEKCLIGHSEDDKAEELIKRIKDALFHPNLMVIYPEYFVDDIEYYRARGVEIKKDRINLRTLDFKDLTRVIDPSDYMRGEATWSLFTPRVDVTGQHFNRVKLDDFVTEKNSQSAERAQKITDVFDSLAGLEEYVIDEETGETKGIPIQITDTQYKIPNMITHALENRDVTAFIMPMTWDPDEHKTIYSYCHEHKYRIDDKIVTDKFIERKKKDFGSEARFLAQCYMIGEERSSLVTLASDSREFIFGYNDESVPKGVQAIELSYDSLHSSYPILLSKDPSYSKIGKVDGDGKSNDVCIRCVYKDNTYWFTGEYSELGNLSLEGQKRGFVALSRDYYPEYVIVDSHGTQIFIANQIFESLKNIEYVDSPYINYVPHTKPKESDTVGKANTIQSVLSAMFQSGSIKVHWKLSKMIKQILRDDKGFDFLDAMVQIMAIPISELETESYFKKMRVKDNRQNKELQKNKKHRKIFKVTGY